MRILIIPAVFIFTGCYGMMEQNGKRHFDNLVIEIDRVNASNEVMNLADPQASESLGSSTFEAYGKDGVSLPFKAGRLNSRAAIVFSSALNFSDIEKITYRSGDQLYTFNKGMIHSVYTPDSGTTERVRGGCSNATIFTAHPSLGSGQKKESPIGDAQEASNHRPSTTQIALAKVWDYIFPTAHALSYRSSCEFSYRVRYVIKTTDMDQ